MCTILWKHIHHHSICMLRTLQTHGDTVPCFINFCVTILMYVQFFCLDNLLSFVWFLSITYFLYIHAGNLELLHIAKNNSDAFACATRAGNVARYINNLRTDSSGRKQYACTITCIYCVMHAFAK